MLDGGTTIYADAAGGGRVSRKERMTRPRYQDGCLAIRGKRRKVWIIRWRENVLQPDGSVKRMQRAETLGPVSQMTRQHARTILQTRFGSPKSVPTSPAGIHYVYRLCKQAMAAERGFGAEEEHGAVLRPSVGATHHP